MNTYLYLEPYIHIWQDLDYNFFYNSLNYKKLLFDRTFLLDEIICKLNNPENFYCIEINGEGIGEVQDFISKIVKNKFGNTIKCNTANKPLVIAPKCIFPQKKENVLSEKRIYFDPNMLNYIQSITLQLTNICDKKCNNCNYLHKQLTFCSRGNSSLCEDDIDSIFEKIKLLKIKKLNFIGGDISSYPHLLYTIKKYSCLNVLKIYNFYYYAVKEELIRKILKSDSKVLVKILVDLTDVSLEKLSKVLDLGTKYTEIIYVFCVSNDRSIIDLKSIVKERNVINYEYHFIFNGSNYDFLYKNYFLNHKDLKSIKLSTNEIYSNQVINSFFFGEIYIKSDRSIMITENFDKIGTLDDVFETIIYNSFIGETPWLLTRNNNICNGCVFRYICPPPTPLELIMNKQQICIDKLRQKRKK